MFLSASGLTGDLVIDLHVDEKQGIKRDGINLFSKIDVDFTDAILGTVLKVRGYAYCTCKKVLLLSTSMDLHDISDQLIGALLLL